MAEVAAGLWAAEEVVSTSVQAGVAGYAVAKPTMPLKATFSQIGSTSDNTRDSLARSGHTLTCIDKRIYIFGGFTSPNELATNDVHSIALPAKDPSVHEYRVCPALPEGAVPSARAEHAACGLGSQLAIHGGRDENGALVDEGSYIWLFDTEKSTWSKVTPTSHPERTPPPRRRAQLLAHDGNLVLYGGVGSDGAALTDVWHFDYDARVWNQLPHAPVATASAAISKDTLYLVASTDLLSNEVHHIDIKLYDQQPPTWSTISVPTNPLTPGPRPRDNGALLPVTTGYGRNFLLYFYGEHLRNNSGSSEQEGLPWSDLWTFQLPSSESQAKLSTDMGEAIKPAKIKDQIRSKVGADTGEATWAEVQVQPPGDNPQASEGKAHPGPRAAFGYDVAPDGHRVVLWGGVGADGSIQGDGWIVTLT